jgi:hypothetical protein
MSRWPDYQENLPSITTRSHGLAEITENPATLVHGVRKHTDSILNRIGARTSVSIPSRVGRRMAPVARYPFTAPAVRPDT